MTNQKLKEIRAQTDNSANLNPADFEHNTNALLLAVTVGLSTSITDIYYLLNLIEKQSRAIEMLSEEIRECFYSAGAAEVMNELDHILSEDE